MRPAGHRRSPRRALRTQTSGEAERGMSSRPVCRREARFILGPPSAQASSAYHVRLVRLQMIVAMFHGGRFVHRARAPGILSMRLYFEQTNPCPIRYSYTRCT